MTPTAIRLLQHRCRAGARKRRSRRMDRCHMNNDWMIVPSHWILSGNPQIRIRSIRKMTASRSSGRRARSTQRQPICGSADWVGQALRARRAGRHGCGAVRPEGFRFHELRQPRNTLAAQTGTVHSRWSAPGTDRRGLAHEAAAMSSAKSQWIRARGSHGMLGLDRSAGKRLEESDVPGDVNAQIEGDRLVQTVVCRG
jgi:hypothetical protein